MNPEQNYKYGLMAFVVMAILFVCAAAYERLSHSGMSTTAVRLSLVAVALLGGVYLLLSGTIYEFVIWVMRRCGKIKPEEVVTTPTEKAKPVSPKLFRLPNRPNRSRTVGCLKVPSIRSADIPIWFLAMQ